MKDITTAIRTAIVARLRNNVTVNGIVIPVRARVQSNPSEHNYIYIPTQNSRNASSKNYSSTDQTVNIECVYRNNDGNDSGMQSMTNQVMQLLTSFDQTNMPQPVGFGLVDFEFVSKNDLTDIDGVGYIFRSVLTFEALVDE